MTEEQGNEEEAQDQEQPDQFGKGTRVRIVEGDNADIEGVVFWWGRSRWGHGMRAGVTPDHDEKEKIWVDATEVRAIDEEGNELDPQPDYAVPPPPVEIEIRAIDVPYALGRTMTAVRVKRGYPVRKADSGGLRLSRLAVVEEELGRRIPDPIIAYVVAALGAIRDVTGVLDLTAEFLGKFEGDDAPDVIIFDRSKGDYLGFRRDAEGDESAYVLFDHKKSFAAAPPRELEARLKDELGEKHEIERTIQPFEVVVDYITEEEPEPEAPTEQWVTHKKFGRGVVQAIETTRKGHKLTVLFEDGETRKLLDSFVEFD